ncbi:methyltransferase [Streptomyces sp. NPDC050416]|uniref:methyltransferase n=1 Tax=Streptomyces sp. NPDC050416 TaxID=3365611 RepID=UPI0037A6E1B6
MSTIHWVEAQPLSARWHSESGLPLPRRVVVADDRMRAAVAHRLACEGTALLWRGDFQNARQLLRAIDRRVRGAAPGAAGTPAEIFQLYRRFRAHRARVLGKLLVLLEEGHNLALRRAPDVSRACVEAYGPSDGPVAVALTELLGVISAREWRENGVHVPALDARIHPHYGVFAPTRSEYVDLVARAPLPGPGMRTAFDLGTGTGVLAAVLARRGVRQVVATDVSARARACARGNVERLGLGAAVRVTGPELYPEGRAGLVVCNPPWIPARPASDLDLGVYDAGGGMLRGFLDGLAGRLEPGGEGWLVLSDLAERLGLRDRSALLDAIETAGLRVVGRIEARPRHSRVRDTDDPLHAVRVAEVTSLWRLAVA